MEERKLSSPAPRIILWDVHNTLLIAKRGDLDSLIQRQSELRAAFEKTVQNFLLRMDAAPLHDLVLRCIEAERRVGTSRGVAFPEIRIEEVWFHILEKIAPREQPVTLEYAREVALFFERNANPKTLMPGAFDTLVGFKKRGLRQGIISNAQFYTAIDLSVLLKDESECSICSYTSVFDPELVIFSYAHGSSKPDPRLFRLPIERIARDGLTAADCLMIGNSLSHDIAPARAAGMRTAWYSQPGEPHHTDDVTADVVVTDLRELLRLL